MAKPYNLFSTEDDITCALKEIFDEELIFPEQQLHELKPEVFEDIEDPNDRIACCVIYSGFSIKGTASQGKSQIINPLWRVIVVTPSELYKTHAGVKMMQSMKILKGLKFDNNQRTLRLVDDVREFNEPDFVNNLVGLPSVYSFDVVI